ncbi:MAG: 50S ribosomal protein L23 [Patescibacteria group bacterium]
MALFGAKKTGQDNKKTTAVAAVKKEAAKPAAASMQDLYADTAVAAKAGAGKGTASALQPGLQKILLKPVITEKATRQVEKNKYSFLVAASANKISVAKAVRALYGVKPLDVNILNRRGKKVARGRIQGQRSATKIALVTLAKGETIKIYEGV